MVHKHDSVRDLIGQYTKLLRSRVNGRIPRELQKEAKRIEARFTGPLIKSLRKGTYKN